jgi:hypothetical protein
MKVAELKKALQPHGRIQLERIVVELYKTIPKSIREEQGIDALILNPDSAKRERKAPVQPDIEAIRYELEEFLSNAYAQHYFAPNSVVPKRERPRWRFIARRLFKELCEAGEKPEQTAVAAELLQRLYVMLCHSCSEVLFNGYDSFESVGVPQADFFVAVLMGNRKIEQPRMFVRNSILLALTNSLNRYTLYDELLDIILSFLETADLKEMAIEICDNLRDEAAAGRLKMSGPGAGSFGWVRDEVFVRNLAILGWRCYMALDLADEAIRYFRTHFAEKNPEIVLFVLLQMIERDRRWDLWLRIYQEAVDSGIRPRENLRILHRDIQEKSFPEVSGGRKSGE